MKEDGSTWTLNGPDSAAAIVPGTITGGTLVVDPVLSGFDLVVGPMGRLEGMGGVRMLTSGGVFSPGGDGVAAMFSVAGDLNLQPGGFFNVDILGNGMSDVVTVDGTATVGGTLAVNGVMFPTGFPIENEYAVLTSPGAVVGSFDSVVDNLPDVDAMVMILPPTGPLDPDPNQPGRVIVSYMRSADTSDKAILPNSVQFASQAGLLFGETLQRQARLLNRCYRNGKSFWHTGLGSHTEVESAGGITGYDGGIGGYAAGADRQIVLPEACFRFGMAGAYTGGSVNSGFSTAEIDANYIAAYASLVKQAWLMSGAMNYGFLDYNIHRGIPMGGGGPPMVAHGSADGGMINFSWATSYNLAQQLMFADGSDFRFAPIARFDYINAYRSGYRESGAALLDLTTGSTRYRTGIVSLGVETGRRMRTKRGWDVNTLFDVRWEHLTGNLNAMSTSTLTNVGGAPFVDAGVAEVRNRVALGVGVGVDVTNRVSTHLRYDAAVANRTSSQRGSGGVTFRY